MRFFICLIAIFFATPALGCEGYSNAISALETAIEQSSPKSKRKETGPPIASINSAIEDLEAAIKKRKSKQQTGLDSPIYRREQKPHL